MRAVALTAMAIAFSAAVPAQSPGTFDAASIRVNRSGSGMTRTGTPPGGGYTAQNATLRALIVDAYQVPESRIRGGPSWVGSEYFDINAKSSATQPELVAAMLRALLADRFQLVTRIDPLEVDGYRLVIAREGLRLKRNDTADCRPPCGGTSASAAGQLTSRKVPLSRFARTLGSIIGWPVVDGTGLHGEFDIDLDWAPEAAQFGGKGRENPDDSRPSLFTALQEQAGLRLAKTRTSVDVLTIDSAARPSEN